MSRHICVCVCVTCVSHFHVVYVEITPQLRQFFWTVTIHHDLTPKMDHQDNLCAKFLQKIFDLDLKKGKNSRMLTKPKYDLVLSRLQALKSPDEKFTQKDYNYVCQFQLLEVEVNGEIKTLLLLVKPNTRLVKCMCIANLSLLSRNFLTSRMFQVRLCL